MDRFIEVVLPIFVLAAFVAFIYHRTQVKKDGKTFIGRITRGKYGTNSEK